MGDGHSPTHGRGAVRTFRASRRKWSGLFAISVLFVALGVWMVVSGESFGWYAIVFFAAGIVVAGWQLVVPARLTVTSTTIELVSMGKKWTLALSHCGPFTTWKNPEGGHRLVVFDYVGDSNKLLNRLSRQISGASSALPDTYGLSAEELADVLNQARAAAQAPGQQTAG